MVVAAGWCGIAASMSGGNQGVSHAYGQEQLIGHVTDLSTRSNRVMYQDTYIANLD